MLRRPFAHIDRIVSLFVMEARLAKFRGVDIQ